jgi:GNAT superfamily N-acetyltransferase
VRRAGAADRDAVETFLRARMIRAMFPLSITARHGIEGGEGRATTFWIDEAGGAIRGVLGMSGDGMVLPVCPETEARDMAAVIAGRRVMGVMGAAEEVRPLVAAIGLDGAQKALDEDEPQFVLDLAALVVPEGPGHLVPLGDIPEETAIAWRRDYLVEILGTPPATAGATAASDIAHYLAEDSHRALVDGDTPLAMTGFNARLPDIVQVGAVYTPPPLRSRGLARRAVALHLAEARARGVGQATLFASGPAAVRAYEALGFRRTGTWTIVLLAEPEAAHG